MSLLVDPYLLDGRIRTMDLCLINYIMDGCAHTTCHVSDISVVFFRRFSDSSVLVGHILIKNFTPPSLLDLML